MRASLKKKRNKDLFDSAMAILNMFLELFQDGKIDLRFFDESGFSLTPCVPYRWQPRGAAAGIECARSKTINTLGFLSPGCSLSAFTVEGSVTSEVVAACFDAFIKENKTEKPLIIIADNAPTHKSRLFMEKIEEWAAQGCFVVFIPPYSPELNIIEILWRFIKYEWLDVSAYESFDKLKSSLNAILENVGSVYKIDFPKKFNVKMA